MVLIIFMNNNSNIYTIILILFHVLTMGFCDVESLTTNNLPWTPVNIYMTSI